VIRAAWGSVAHLAIIPLQDLLELDNTARFNYPGTADGNWRWRVTPEALHGPHWQRLRDLTELYDR
jgi:4-alpha-glucanotransferase